MQHCDACEVLFINNIKTHELGCPDAWKDEERECKFCGSMFKPENKHQEYCGDTCSQF